MQSQFYPESEDGAYMAIGEISRRAIDGTVPPLFVDYPNQKVLIRNNTASAATNLFEVAGGLFVTTAGNTGILGTLSITGNINTTGSFTLIGSQTATGNVNIIGNISATGGIVIKGGGVAGESIAIVSTGGADTRNIKFINTTGGVDGVLRQDNESDLQLTNFRGSGTFLKLGSNNTTWAYLSSAGDFGVRQQLPVSAIHVSGNILDQGSLSVTGNINSTGSLNCVNVTAGGLNITSTANFRSDLNITGGAIVSGGTMTVYSGSTVLLTMGVWSTWTPTFGGFSVDPTVNARYILIGKTCVAIVTTTVGGTSNATTFTITLPVTSSNAATLRWHGYGEAIDNGTQGTIPVEVKLSTNTTTANVYKDFSLAGWTASGTKYANFTIIYETT